MSLLRLLLASTVQICTISLVLLAIERHKVEALERSDFFPFGANNGDASPFPNDDSSVSLAVGVVPYTFYNRQSSILHINNNGIISIGGRLGSFSDDPFPLEQAFQTIAVLYGDVDSRGMGTLHYRISSDQEQLRLADGIIGNAFVSALGFRSRSIVVATWDRVGYYNRETDRLNTFQCVLATDGLNTFALMLYAQIEWLRADPDGNAAQVGFNAGDGVNFQRLPGTTTDQGVLNLTQASNMGVPGMWAFKVSEATIESAGCNRDGLMVPTTIYPTFGTQLGGTLVSVQGPCFLERANIQCEFEGRSTVALYESEFRVHCTTPPMARRGRVPFRLLVDGEVRGETTFNFLSVEEGYQVHLSNTSSSHPLLLTDQSTLELTWSPEDVLPQVNLQTDPYKIDILLYTLDTDSAQWVEHSILADNVPNNGSETVRLPSGLASDVVPFAILVATSLNSATVFDTDGLLYMKLFRSQQRAGVWTSQYYYVNPLATGIRARELCSEWFASEPQVVPVHLGNDSTPCPPTQDRARLASSGMTEVRVQSVFNRSEYGELWMQTFHPRAEVCFRQALLDTGSSEQECCYDNRGYLISGTYNGGSIKSVSANYDRALNFVEDVRPFLLCCTGESPNCALYYSRRPSDDGSRFSPSLPGWVLGDPHLVTLDGLRYTFNGKGEFTLLEHPSSSLLLQGRMQSLPDAPNGTVLTAIAARMGGESGERVMITTSYRGIDVYLDGRRIDFSVTSEFEDFTILNRAGVASIRYSNGAYLECRQADSTHQWLSGLVVSLPEEFYDQSATAGLLGNFNGVPDDDLLPRGVNATLVSVNSGLQAIHEQFGVTWLITNPSESLFTYLPFEDMASISDVSYRPRFEAPTTPEVLTSCQGDLFCAFDSTVTGSVSFGQMTLGTVMEVNMTEQIAAEGPVTCSPPCSNGACVPGNECACPEGFSGELCEMAVTTDCSSSVVDPCVAPERCFMQAGSVMCVLDCDLYPNSDSCATTEVPVLVIAVAASVVGVTLIIIVILVIIIVVMCSVFARGKRRQRKVLTNGNEGSVNGRFNKTVVGSTTPPTPPLNKLEMKQQVKKLSNSGTLPPSYSELGIDKPDGNAPGTSGTDYKNIPNEYETIQPSYRQNGPGRRSSLGAINEVSSGKTSGHGRLSLTDRAHSHNVISVSPDSEASGSPREKGQGANRRSSGHLSPIQDEAPWYRSSTPSVLSGHTPSSATSPTSPGSGGRISPRTHSHSPFTRAAHMSLHQSFSNPVASQHESQSQNNVMDPENQTNGASRSAQYMSRSSSSMGHQIIAAANHNLGARSSSSMGRGVIPNGGMRRGVQSIPASMDHFTDV